MSESSENPAVDALPEAIAGALPFVPVVVGREVQRVTFPSPNGPLEGYQLRFQLEALQPDGSSRSSWTEWLHLPNPLMLFLTESLDTFMRTEGHLVGTAHGVKKLPG